METPGGDDEKNEDQGGGKEQTPKKTEASRPTTLLESPGKSGGPTRLKDRVSFYEQVWTGTKSPSVERQTEKSRSTVDDSSLFVDVSEIERRLQEEQRRRREESPMKREHVKLRSTPLSSPRGGDARHRSTSSSSNNSESFEETFERVVEEGDLLGGGAKVVKFERITVHKSVREITTVRPTTPGSGAASSEVSRTPSEEHILQDDSAYHTASHSQPSANGFHTSVSKSSSVTSLAGRFPSEESLRRTPSKERIQHAGSTELDGQGSRPASTSSNEWYSEYRTQSFQNMAARLEYVRSRSQYDTHIAEIKGKSLFKISKISSLCDRGK